MQSIEISGLDDVCAKPKRYFVLETLRNTKILLNKKFQIKFRAI